VLSIGEILREKKSREEWTGRALVRFAYHASRQGAESYVISAVCGESIREKLNEQLTNKGLSSEYIGCLNTAENANCNDFSPSSPLSSAWAQVLFTDKVKSLFKRGNALYFEILSLRHQTTIMVLKYIFEHINANCLKVFDVNLHNGIFNKDALTFALHQCDVLKVNVEELQFLSDVLNLNGHKAIMDILANYYNLKYIILTSGVDGSVLYDGDGFVAIPALSYGEKVVSAGCGDAFIATFITALLHGVRPADAMLQASKIAGYVCTKSDPMPEIPPELRLVSHYDESKTVPLTT
jgi:fructokinase